MREGERLPFDGLLEESVRGAMTAIMRESAAAIEQSKDSMALFDGTYVGPIGQNHVWSFTLDHDVAPLAETPGTLLVAGLDPMSARVLATGDLTIVLGLREYLDPATTTGTLSLSAGFVLGALRGRLDNLLLSDQCDTELTEALLMPDLGEYPRSTADGDGEPSASHDIAADADDDQEWAALRAIEPGLRFTWGPPGTGKTKVLAMATAEAARRGQRVLVLAHANAAVDVAISRIAEELGADSEVVSSGRVLRVGTPQLPGTAGQSEILPDRIINRLEPELVARRDALDAARRRLSDELHASTDEIERSRKNQELNEVRAESESVTKDIAAATRRLITDAQVIATTLSKAVIDAQIWSWDSDIVIIDEASMAGLPFVLALAARGAETLSCFGDFRQLPPIAVSNDELAQHWFGRDVFEQAGVVEAHEAALPDRRLSPLRVQFRMGSQICATVNDLAYDGMLRTHPTARNRAIQIAESEPCAGNEMLIVDLSGFGAVCSIDAAIGSYSRFNLLSAAVSATLANRLVMDSCESVGVISAYRAQVQLLAAMCGIDDRIGAATIHKFQGSERDAIVFDLTDGFDQPGPSTLTGRSSTDDVALRLMNVAVSRARGKLVLVADLDFVDERHPPNSAARTLLHAADENGATVIRVADLMATNSTGSGTTPSWLPDWDRAARSVIEISVGGSPLEANVPDDDWAGDWLVEAAERTADEMLVRTTLPIARSLQHTSAAIRLRTAGAAPWLIAGDTLVVGSQSSAGPAAVMTHAPAVRVVRRLLIPGD